MLVLKSLKINSYRNLKDVAEMEFTKGINVLLGKNGTGKTTLLNLLVMIIRSDFTSLKEEKSPVDFEFVSELTLPGEEAVEPILVRFALKTERAEKVSLITKFLGRTHSRDWSFQFKVAFFADTSISIRLASDGSYQFIPDIEVSKTKVMDANLQPLDDVLFLTSLLQWYFGEQMGEYDVPWDGSIELRTIPLLSGIMMDGLNDKFFMAQGVGRFDEALLAFQKYEGKSVAEESLPLKSEICLERSDEEMPITSFSVPLQILRDISNRLDRKDAVQVVVGDISQEPKNESEACLRHFAAILGVQVFEAHPKLEEESETEAIYEGWDFYITQKDGRKFHHSKLSFGQKRMIAFLWYANSLGDFPIIADELVNGFHYDWIEACIDEIGDRQAFIASQNPLIMDFLEFEDSEQVRKSFILCAADDMGKWTWGNMSQRAAESFFQGYEVGIQHVSSILRAEGLW